MMLSKIAIYFIFSLLGLTYIYFFPNANDVDAVNLYGTLILFILGSTFIVRPAWTIAYGFWLFVTIYTVGGSLVYILRELFYFNFVGDVKIPLYNWFITTFVTFFFSIVQEAVGISNERKLFREFRFSSVWRNIFIAGGLVACVFMFRNGIPLLADDVNEARTRMSSETQGIFWFLYMGLQITLITELVRLIFSDWSIVAKFLNLLSITFLTILLSLYGGRFFAFMPFVLVVAYSVYVGRLTPKFLVYGSFVLFTLVIFVSSSRFASRADDIFTMLELGLRNDIFPELRTLVQVSSLSSNFDISYIFNPFISFLPSAFYTVFGIDKNTELMLSIGSYISSFDPEAENVGYRVTILGEIYLALGYTGVAIAVGLVNLLSIFFSKIIKDDLFYIYLFIMFCMLVPYGVTFIRSSLIMLPVGYFIIYMVTRRG